MKKGTTIITLILSAIFIILLYNNLSKEGSASYRMADITSSNDRSLGKQTQHPESTYKVVIDPGHGGKDVGATGASGRFEKEFTLQLARKVEELTEQETQLEVYLTRTEDQFISSVERARPEFANQLGADLFISIHGNTYEDSSVAGTETYYYHDNSIILAELMHKHIVKGVGFRDRGVKHEDFFVLKDTNMPAVLLEVGYLTNPQEEEDMLTEEVQTKMASSILDGIKEYLELQ
ncbi:N-acetylmuramoyl-L-alanine amidase family protein [Paenibacillus lautus]|uniref:N-acetylmuramoyl-L-alanine amidase family protein n=1 Tax=Paenibacillus lautus TaxID=1401 RepID=UPI003D2A5DDD